MKQFRKSWIIIGIVSTSLLIAWGIYSLWGSKINVIAKSIFLKDSRKNKSISKVKTFKGLPVSGDILLPTFSPDGRFLAFAQTWPEKSKDSKRLEKAGGKADRIEIGVYDTHLNQYTIYISFNNVEYYAIYASWIIDLQWRGNQNLYLRIGDGDVGYTDTIYDIKTCKFIKENYIGDDTDEGHRLSPESKKILDESKQLFPDLTNWELMEYNFNEESMFLSKKSLLLHKGFSGEEPGVWFLDIDSQEVRKVVDIPDDVNFKFQAGLIFDEAALFALYDNSKIKLCLYQNKDVQEAAELEDFSDWPIFDIKYKDQDKVIFLVCGSNYYKNNRSYLYQCDRNGLTQILNEEIIDVAINPNGKDIVICYLENGKRKIKMGKLE